MHGRLDGGVKGVGDSGGKPGRGEGGGKGVGDSGDKPGRGEGGGRGLVTAGVSREGAHHGGEEGEGAHQRRVAKMGGAKPQGCPNLGKLASGSQ